MKLKAHRGSVAELLVHPSQNSFISASHNGMIKTWCMETFQLTQQIDTGLMLTELRLGKDPRCLFVLNNHQVCFN